MNFISLRLFSPEKLTAFMSEHGSVLLFRWLPSRDVLRVEFAPTWVGRRWFQYHVTALRAFLCDCANFLSASHSGAERQRRRNLWLQFSCLGSIVRFGGCFHYYFPSFGGWTARAGKTGRLCRLKQGEVLVFVESFLSGLWFPLDSFGERCLDDSLACIS